MAPTPPAPAVQAPDFGWLLWLIIALVLVAAMIALVIVRRRRINR